MKIFEKLSIFSRNAINSTEVIPEDTARKIMEIQNGYEKLSKNAIWKNNEYFSDFERYDLENHFNLIVTLANNVEIVKREGKSGLIEKMKLHHEITKAEYVIELFNG